MSTEPHITGESVWAAIKGAIASTVIVFALLIIVILVVPSTPQDDGHIRIAVVLIGLLPFVFGVMFAYFLVLSAKKNRPFKFAIIIQSLLILHLTVLVFNVVSEETVFFVAISSAIYIFIFFSLSIGVGAWFWSKTQKSGYSVD